MPVPPKLIQMLAEKAELALAAEAKNLKPLNLSPTTIPAEFITPTQVGDRAIYYHWSPEKNLTELDAKMFGRNPVTSREEVRHAGVSRIAAFSEGGVPESFFGLTGTARHPYMIVDEGGLPMSKSVIYDMAEDPRGLRAQLGVAGAERFLHQEGRYKGWEVSKSHIPLFEGQVRFFNKVRVQPVHPETMGTEALSFVSWNMKPGGTDMDAIHNLSSPQYQKGLVAADALASTLFKQKKVRPGIGFWRDGAEDTYIVEFNGYHDQPVLDYFNAKMGRAGRQKATLSFQHGPMKPDHIYTAEVGSMQSERVVAEAMRRMGLDYFTLSQRDPVSATIKMYAVDAGDPVNHDKFQAVVQELGATDARYQRGSARFLEAGGNGDRTDRAGREASAGLYQSIESAHERTPGRTIPRGWDSIYGSSGSQGTAGQDPLTEILRNAALP